MEVFEDVVEYIAEHDWAVLAFGFDPYNAGPFVEKWSTDFRGYWYRSGATRCQNRVRTAR